MSTEVKKRDLGIKTEDQLVLEALKALAQQLTNQSTLLGQILQNHEQRLKQLESSDSEDP